jgi:transposase
LGCPVRFSLTAGQKGDAPQANELTNGLPAEVVIADTAYDADHLRKDIAAKKALHRSLEHRGKLHPHENLDSRKTALMLARKCRASGVLAV